MAAEVQRGPSRRGRRLLVWMGGPLLLLGLIMGGALLYLRWAGAPDWLKRRLEDALRTQGLLVQLGDVHWRGWNVLARDVQVTGAGTPPGPTAILPRVRVRLDPQALRQGRIRPEEMVIEGGQIGWRSRDTNGPSPRLPIQNLAAELRFLPHDQWEVVGVAARALGAEIRVTGSITNASALRSWFRLRETPQTTPRWRERVDQWLATLEPLQLGRSTSVELEVKGDGRDPDSFQLKLQVDTPRAAWPGGTVEKVRAFLTTQASQAHPGASDVGLEATLDRLSVSWGELQAVRLTSHLAGSLTNRSLLELDWQLTARSFQNHSSTGHSLTVTGRTLPTMTLENPFQTHLEMAAMKIITPWSDSQTNHANVCLTHGRRYTDPWQADWHLAAGPVRSRWGQAAQARLAGHARSRTGSGPGHGREASWGPWSWLDPYELDWTGELTEVRSPQTDLDRVACAGEWRTPIVTLRDLQGALYGGHFSSSARLDVATRELRAKTALDFDVHKVSSLLTPRTRRWLNQFGWQTPPQVTADVRLVLPAWTNSHPVWREEVMPTIELAGEFEGHDGTFRGIPVTYARSHFSLTNLVWRLPDLCVARPDGDVNLIYTGNMGTRDFHWQVDGRVDPRALGPLIPAEAVRRTVNQLEFDLAPSVRGEIWGRWHEPETVCGNGRVTVTNFTFRGELCSELATAVQWTNAVLQMSDLIIRQGTQQIRVPHGAVDLKEKTINVTHAISTMDPDLVARVIGPKVRAALRPYRFEQPPTVRVSGRLPMLDIADADVHFQVVGQAFRYWRLQAPSVTGDVFWRGFNLSITNVHATFYGGQLDWRGQFDFAVRPGARLAFEGAVKNADFHSLMVDLGSKTNHLQGSLNGEWIITSARSDDWRSWQGSGRVKLRDGFLWEIPIFGFFSPMLNSIVPGLGNSPISAAEGTFTIDRSVIETSDLELKSPALRLLYYGTIDFQGNVDARMQAEILRDAWGVGRVLSLVLWPISKAFEYRITGPLNDPKSEPVYIPKALLHILHPFKSIKQLFGGEGKKPSPTPQLFLSPPKQGNESGFRSGAQSGR